MSIGKFTFDSVDEIQLHILEKLFSEGQFIVTREHRTLEICHVNLCLSNPRNRNTYNTKRKWKFPLAIGEFAWHVSASNSLDFITYYARQWKDFSLDGKLIRESCYGHKIFKIDSSGDSQWNRVVKLLKYDKFSRRAVLALYDSNGGIDDSVKDVACVCTIQFLIRNEKLDAIVNMRSNDLIWGFPYDVYFLTMLQELLSLELEVEIGKYYHNVGSMHIYEKHFGLGKEMLNYTIQKKISEPKMEEIGALKEFIKYEELIRTGKINTKEIQDFSIHQYWKSLLIHLGNFKNEKINK
ncbi:MAG: thyA [Bacteroidota bacterium]|jgi:thymidylate synthase|nr:thyA [Bacteroidota bacterium]